MNWRGDCVGGRDNQAFAASAPRKIPINQGPFAVRAGGDSGSIRQMAIKRMLAFVTAWHVRAAGQTAGPPQSQDFMKGGTR